MVQIRIRTSLRSGSFLLKTLDDFSLPGFEFEDRTYYSDFAKRRELISFFCTRAGLRQHGEILLDLLDELEKGSASDEEIRAGMLKIAAAFERIGAGLFLGRGGYRDYLPGAEEAAAKAPPKNKTSAWVHVLLYSMLCRTRFGHFSPEIQQALLSSFIPAGQSAAADHQKQWREIRIDAGHREFQMNWDIAPFAPVTPCRLINPSMDKSASLVLHTPIGQRRVTVPAGGSLNALFSGSTMTCLKGNIQHRKDSAMSKNAKDGFDRIDLRSGRITEVKLHGGAPLDFSMGAYGELGVLRGSTLHMPELAPMDDVMGIFSTNDCWIAVMWDGSTQSNRMEYCAENVLAVVQDEEGMAVVDRHVSAQKREQLMRRMLERFNTGNMQYAEQLRLHGGMLRLKADNCLQWEEYK